MTAEYPTIVVRQDALCDLLGEVLAEMKSIRAALGTSARSSVELAENAKGGVQITVKAYAEAPIDSACTEAIAAFATMKDEVRRGQMDDWASALDMVRADREARP